uniref:Radical SAM protein n=1 Tax=Fervidobacterium thailandense TaxID=1008305 RepID=A0A7C4VU51_9BACT
MYCNQRVMTGEELLAPQELARNDFSKVDEIAFYGGTFTGLDLNLIEDYLKLAPEKPKRISTRPDAITEEVVALLKKYNVRTVELGIESLFEDVLHASRRYYDEGLVRNVIESLKKDFDIVAHLMTGLPKDSSEKSLISTLKLLEMGVKTFRIHPTLVFAGTELEKMYRSGQYEPQPLEEAVITVARILVTIESHGGKVIRLGYHVPKSQNGYIVAGPYHPSFGDLVRARLVKEIVNSLRIKVAYVPGRFLPWFTSYGNNELDLTLIPTEGEEILLDNLAFVEAESLYFQRFVKQTIFKSAHVANLDFSEVSTCKS